MKNIIKENYESTVKRGLITPFTTTKEFLFKIEEELDELFDSFLQDDETFDKYELADVIMVCLNMAHHYDIDIIETIKQKIEINKNR
jgi:NTP pyrophosphatase (non-canonical NTP hydrolase)